MKTIEQIFRHHFIAAGAKHENISFEKAEEIFEINMEIDKDFWPAVIICVQKTVEEYNHQFFVEPEFRTIVNNNDLIDWDLLQGKQNALPSQLEEREIKKML